MTLRWPHSLRTRLLWSLGVAIAVTALVQATMAYRSALDEADQIFDYHMQQTALTLRTGFLNTDVDADAGAVRDAENDAYVVQVWSANGLQVFQSAARVGLPQRAVLGFSDVQANGTTYRVFSIETGTQVIQVAQDMAARRGMAGTLALRIIAPIALMAPLLMLVVWWVVSRSLAPVARVRRQVAERQADDLSPLGEEGLPDEIRPLAQELNLLFGRVQRAFEAQQNFVADAAHELRSPLAALKLQALGLERAADDATRARAVARLGAGIDRATRLVDQLLVLARHEASLAARIPPQPVVLADVVRLALADALPAARARDLDLGMGASDETAIAGHADALRILVRNLIDNAVKYTPPGGQVDVGLQIAAACLRLTVEDSGPGIPEEDRGRVADRFYRVNGADATGSGLGLAIVKSIAEMHGATLALGPSQRLGGLAVAVDFPLAS